MLIKRECLQFQKKHLGPRCAELRHLSALKKIFKSFNTDKITLWEKGKKAKSRDQRKLQWQHRVTEEDTGKVYTKWEEEL